MEDICNSVKNKNKLGKKVYYIQVSIYLSFYFLFFLPMDLHAFGEWLFLMIKIHSGFIHCALSFKSSNLCDA